jgi:hypothetical protein
MLSKERLGKFTASDIHKLFVGGKGATRDGYILEKAEEIVKGHAKDAFFSKYTEHGIVNEWEGVQVFEEVTGMNVEYLEQQFFKINDNCGTTPDFAIVDFGGTRLASADMKCPATKFFEQKMLILKDAKPEFQNCTKQHYLQVQMQMLSMGVDTGYLVRYLTSANVDENGNKHEYNLPLDVRLFFREIKKDEKIQEAILAEVEKAAAERDIIVEQLKKPITWEKLKEK